MRKEKIDAAYDEHFGMLGKEKVENLIDEINRIANFMNECIRKLSIPPDTLMAMKEYCVVINF